jgi:hypothetical protein
MKARTFACITAMTLFAVLALPGQVAAPHARYKLIDLSTFGGPQNYLYVPDNYNRVLSNRGTVVGSADTPRGRGHHSR